MTRLTEEVVGFIEKDMKNYDLEHISDYISEFNRDISDDMSRRILPEATVACAEMILSIEADSKLLSIIPPAMFLKILRTTLSDGEDFERCVSLEKRIHIISLLVTYLEQNNEVDESTFVIYFCRGFGPDLGVYIYEKEDEVNDAVLVSRAEIALRWLRYIELKGWEKDSLCNEWGWAKLESSVCECEGILSELFLLSETPPSLELMERIVKEAPSDVAARLFRDFAEKGTDWRQREFDGRFRPA